MNKGDIVRKLDKTKSGGRVRYTCCINATKAGNGTCNKQTCPCPVKDYAVVEWPQSFGGGTSSLPFIELELDNTPATAPSEADTISDTLKDQAEKSVAEKEKELAAQYDKIMKDTPPFDFDAYNYGTKKDKQTRGKRELI